jgi:hypothetical protein
LRKIEKKKRIEFKKKIRKKEILVSANESTSPSYGMYAKNCFLANRTDIAPGIG